MLSKDKHKSERKALRIEYVLLFTLNRIPRERPEQDGRLLVLRPHPYLEINCFFQMDFQYLNCLTGLFGHCFRGLVVILAIACNQTSALFALPFALYPPSPFCFIAPATDCK
jgi:hypothetical protein